MGLGIRVSATRRRGWYLARVGRLIHRWGLVRVSYWRALVIGECYWQALVIGAGQKRSLDVDISALRVGEGE